MANGSGQEKEQRSGESGWEKRDYQEHKAAPPSHKPHLNAKVWMFPLILDI